MAEKAEADVEEKARDICRVLDLGPGRLWTRCAAGRDSAWRRTSSPGPGPSRSWWAGWSAPPDGIRVPGQLEARMSEVLANTQLDPRPDPHGGGPSLPTRWRWMRRRSGSAATSDSCGPCWTRAAPWGGSWTSWIQEFNREANTIGSKCSDIDIARHVVDIKAEIEKIREQIQNME